MTHSLSPATAPEPPRQSAGDMPEGAEFERQIRQRNSRSGLWLAFFQVAIIVSIVALGALLFNIINMSFGLVAVQNEVSPATVVMLAAEVDLLASPNTESGEDDTALAAAVAADANAIGRFSLALRTCRNRAMPCGLWPLMASRPAPPRWRTAPIRSPARSTYTPTAGSCVSSRRWPRSYRVIWPASTA